MMFENGLVFEREMIGRKAVPRFSFTLVHKEEKAASWNSTLRLGKAVALCHYLP